MPLTPKNRKEEWLEGFVEHETTLTPKNRCEAWMKEIIDASGGGGGSVDLGITGASVGEYAKIKTVDADGAPTAWESGTGGGGGGGVLVCTFDTNTGALDKTWNEISSSSFAVVKFEIMPNSYEFRPVYSAIVGVRDPRYGVFVMKIMDGEVTTDTFAVSTADGYPVIQAP